MNTRRLVLSSSVLLLAGAALLAGCSADPESSGKTGVEEAAPPPPLEVDMAQPLLLEEPAAGDADAQTLAGSAPCLHCHANYAQEPMASRHAHADIGCIECHGDSFAHRNDENNVTPPDTMYPRDAVDAACGKCHEGHDVPAVKVVARWKGLQHPPAEASRIVCTDCHGRHRLAVRTVRWNKKTRELIPADAAR